MTKYRTLGPGNGITGPTGLEYRNLTNDMIPADAYFVPEDFVWTGDLSPVANRTLIISYEHNVSGNITLPAGCTLLFDGGKFSTVGTITGSNSKVLNPRSLPCFDDTIAFAGTWSETTCNYQWFGAKSNDSLATYSNECSAAINKAHNSPFKVQPLPGFYYISDTLIFNTAKHLDFGMSSAKHDDDNSMPASQVVPSQVCFYTDQDIDMWDLRMSGVNIFGGQINVAGVGTYNSDCIKIKAENVAFIDGRILGTKVVGNLVGNAVSGASGKAFHYDTSDNTKYGCLANIVVDLHALFIPYGIYIDPPSSFPTTWFGVSKFNCIADGCKQGYVVQHGFHNVYTGYTQNRAVLAYEEQDLYQAEFSGGNTIDIFAWDLSSRDHEEPAGSGRYYASRGMLIKGADNQLIGNAIKMTAVTYEVNYAPLPVKPVTERSNISILSQKINKESFISDIHNMLLGFDKRATFTIKAHDGSVIDFDNPTPTIGSEAETANITFTGMSGLFKKGATIPTYVFNAGADINKDFVELAFIGESFAINSILHMYFEGYRTIFNRIQVIGFKSAGDPDIFNIYPDPTTANYRVQRYSVTFLTSYTSLAIRLIGVPALSQSVYFKDLAIERRTDYVTFPLKSELPMTTFHALLNQSGTDAPTMAIRLNTMSDTYTPSCSYQGVGSYRLNYNYQFPADKMLPVSLTFYTDLGTIVITRATDSYYTIQTYDTNDSPANGILVNQPIILNRYW